MLNQKLTISLEQSSLCARVKAVQNDTGRTLVCRIPNFPNLSSCSARIFATKPSGNVIYNYANVNTDTVDVELTSQMLAEQGDVRCQVQLTQSSKTVTSFEFILEVAENMVTSGALESTNELSALQEALEQIGNLDRLGSFTADMNDLIERVEVLEDRPVTGGSSGGSTGGSTGGNTGGSSSGSSSGTGAGDYIDIRDFGAVDDGVTDNYDAINAAFDALPNGGTIQFPRTENGYAIYDAIYVPEYVSLVGNKTKIIRKHDYHVHHNAFVFLGHNNFENFVFDGGGADRVNMIQYTDFSIHGNGVIFRNNEISENRGTCIGGYGNCTITNNFFGEFGDHLVYMGGGNTLTSGNYIFANNHVNAPVVTRDVMKFRNAGKNVIISNNLYNVPNGNIITFTNGDNYLDQGVMENLMFTNNNIVAARYLCVIGQQLVGNSNNTGKIKNVLISGNTINARDYMIIGDSLLQDGDDMTNFKDTTIVVSNNTFEQTPCIHITSVGLLHTVFEGNTFRNLNAGSGSLFAIRGNVDFDFTNNFVDQPDDLAYNFVTMANKFTAYHGATTAPTRIVKWNIGGNTMHGFRILLADNVNGEAYFNENTTTTIRDNILYKTGLISSLGTATGDGLITLYNNLYYFAGQLATLTVGRLNTVELGVANMQAVTGAGSPAGTVVPRCVGDTYLDMTNKTVYTAFFKGDKNNGWYAGGSGGGSDSGSSTTSVAACQTGTGAPTDVVPRWAGDRYMDTSTYTMYVAVAAVDKNTWFPIQRRIHLGEGDPNSALFANGPGELYVDTISGALYIAHARGALSWITNVKNGQGSPLGTVVPKNIGDRYIDTQNQKCYTAYAKNDYNSWKCDSGEAAEEIDPCLYGVENPSASLAPRWDGDIYINKTSRVAFIGVVKNDGSTWTPVQRGMHRGEGDPNSVIYAYAAGEIYLDTSTSIKWTAMARGSISWVAEFQVGDGSPIGVVPPRFVGDRYIDKTNKKTYTGYIKLDMNNGWGVLD